MSNLSDLLPSGGGSKSAEFVASGTLPNGQAVILNSDGTVTAVALSTQPVPIAVPTGSETAYTSAIVAFNTVQWDGATGRFVAVYADPSNSYYGTAMVGTVSGTSIVFSTNAYVWRSADSRNVKFAMDPNTAGKMVIVFSQNLGTLSGVVGTYTGTGASASMSFGSDAVILNYDIPGDLAVTYDPNTANRFVIMAHAPTNQGKGIVGNISGTTMTMGTAVDWAGSSGSAPYPRAVNGINYDKTADKFITAFADGANSTALNAIVGTISSTDTLTFGTRTTSSLTGVIQTSIAGDPLRTTSGAIAYNTYGSNYTNNILVTTLSGTTVSFGAVTVFDTGAAYFSIFMGSGTQDLGGCVSVADPEPNGTYTVAARTFTISGTSIASLGTRYSMLVIDPDPQKPNAQFNPAQLGQFIVNYNLHGSSPYIGGRVQLGQFDTLDSNLTATNFVGMPDEAYASGATATVVLQGGISLNQTSLTIGSTYYVQSNGSLSTSVGSPSVEAGRAISATSLLIKGI
mgnify:CR=1 FL=1